MPPQRIYLDNAATSWPKPPAVYDAVDRYQRENGAAAGRGAYRDGATVDDAIRRCRQAIAKLLGGVDPKQIAFCFNGTDALNLALHGLLRPGDHVVTSVVEHNSVLRPLKFLAERIGINVTHVPCDAAGVLSPSNIASALTDKTRLVAVAHASNVTGAIQPIEEISDITSRRAVRFLVDAAQSLGHLPTSYRDLPIDLVAAPGHKGLLGPLGTGLLYLRPGMESEVTPLRQGGTGTSSDEDTQPTRLPERYESGNHNVPGLMGLGAGAAYLLNETIAEIRRHEIDLTARLIARLQTIPGLTLYGPLDPTRRVGVVSFNLQGYNPQELATLLDSAYGVQTRAGLHCAPLMHRALGTLAAGGTVRISPGPFTTAQEIDQTTAAIREIASAS